eukprot:TRINITY_DN2913_c0_g1_i1.p2 TRINITY_DN2913_c0_g1~~TRINITY_DN2913_c0_g1_i1.p2  ORF type:complete len:115 (-),score=5.52 TRINITY_DN2913_c0_g1_i1:78-422(-)
MPTTSTARSPLAQQARRAVKLSLEAALMRGRRRIAAAWPHRRSRVRRRQYYNDGAEFCATRRRPTKFAALGAAHISASIFSPWVVEAQPVRGGQPVVRALAPLRRRTLFRLADA